MTVLSQSLQVGPVDTSAWRAVVTHTHTYSGRADHGGANRPPGSYRRLAAWARARGIDAIGMGSPWTPANAAAYAKYEGPCRDDYYGGRVDVQALRDPDDLRRMLDEANAFGAGETWFYLDNETPKGRYGHLWWVGWGHDYPAWHDYDQVWDRWMVDEATPEQDGLPEPMPYERRAYREIVAAQRAAAALGFWAHPTSWWRGERGQFITNIAAELPAHLIADGFVDGMVIMGYDPWRPQYFDLWTHLLDAGFRVPGVAEMDMGLSVDDLDEWPAAMRTLVRLGERAWSAESLTGAFGSGRVVATTGPFVELDVDGAAMGSAAPTAPGRKHEVRITAQAADASRPLGCVELLGPGGQVLWRADDFPGGSVVLAVPGRSRRGYLLARVFGAGQCPGSAAWRDVREVAISNPVYLHPPGEGFARPATTELELTIRDGSPLAGGTLHLEDAAGGEIERAVARAGTLRRTMPASGRVRLTAPDGAARTEYLINANEPLQQIQRYLHRGGFVRDFPSAESGDVPVAAWRLTDYRQAMQRVEMTR